MTSTPLVSCIMPTYNRRRFVSQSIWYFLRQDYAARELIIVDDGSDAVADLVPDDERIRYVRLDQQYSVGAKRNLACEVSRGELIAHWDEDNWYADNRLSLQVAELLSSKKDVCGASDILFYHLMAGKAWRYRDSANRPPWLAGTTLLYRRSAWAARRFPDHDIDEDTAFVRQFAPDRLHPIADSSFAVAIIHQGNATTKRLTKPGWQRCPLSEVTQLLDVDRDFYVALRNGRPYSPNRLSLPQLAQQAVANPATVLSPQSQKVVISSENAAPLVSCIMPTRNRPSFALQAIRYFQQQDYPARELLIIDDSSFDGTPGLAEQLPDDPRIRYLQLPTRKSIGNKRNRACEMARGRIIAQWDDDDWYAPNRLSKQVEPLLSGEVEITALDGTIFFDLSAWKFWTCSRALHRRLFVESVHGGTLVYRREVWEQLARYPNRSLAEDAIFLRKARRRGARLARIANDKLFFYLRHGTNSWSFTCGQYLDAKGWQCIAEPTLPPTDRAFYVSMREQLHNNISGNGLEHQRRAGLPEPSGVESDMEHS